MLHERGRDLLVVTVQIHGRVVAGEARIHAGNKSSDGLALLFVMIDIKATDHPFLYLKKIEIRKKGSKMI